MPKNIFSIAAINLGVSIIFFSTIPLAFPEAENFGFYIDIDKLMHVFAYFIFSISVFGSLYIDWKNKKAMQWTISLSLLLGFSLELIQGAFLSFRSFEVYDLLANVTGVILFTLLLKSVKKILLRLIIS